MSFIPGLLAFAVLLATLAAAGSVLVYAMRLGIGPVPSSPAARNAVLAAIPSGTVGEIHDLGSGWGSLVFPLARKFPECAVVGTELSPIPYLASKLRHWWEPFPNLEIRRGDFTSTSLARAAVVVCYLFPGAMERLKPKLIAELRPGTLLVSNSFALRGWTPDRVTHLADLYRTQVLTYRAGQSQPCR